MFNKIGAIVANPKTRWLIILIWVLIIGIFSIVWPQVNEKETTDNQLLPDHTMSVEGNEIVNEEFSDNNGVPLLLVWHQEEGLQIKDVEKIQQLYTSLTEQPVSEQSFIPPFGEMPAEALLGSVSEDGKALITPVFFNETASTKKLQTGLDELEKIIRTDIGEEVLDSKLESDQLKVRFSGPVGIQTDAVSLFSNADITLLITTVLIVFILLIVLYRSPILALVPLVAVGIAYGLISPLLGFLADKGWIVVDGQTISIMTVLLFGAGTDYCLFLISRYRDELKQHEDKYVALNNAITGTGGAIMMSSMTTVIGMLALSLAYYASYDRFAVPFSLSIFIMGIAALTLLPAILALLGRIAFIPFIPRTEEMMVQREKEKGKKLTRPKQAHRFGSKIGGLVTARPWTIIIATTILLSALAAFVPKMQFTYGLLDSFPEDMQSREGFAIIADHYPPGEIAPVKLIVDTKGKEVSLEETLKNHSLVETVEEVKEGENKKDYQLWEFTLNINPYSTEAVEGISDFKQLTSDVLKEEGIPVNDQSIWLAGETASLYDTDQITNRDQNIIIPVLLIVIALLLFVYLKSLVATIYLLATVLLSYASALGLGWIVLHYGFGVQEIQGLIPLYAFVFLVVLGEDYNIFLVSSIWKKRKNMPLKQAIANSVAETGSVISSAGLILAGTFSVLAVMPLQVLVHFGAITAIGILLDTFIVRPLLVPSITAVLGRHAFWPGKYCKVDDGESYHEYAGKN
ncbi:MMPL family transporter [Lederbergia sp. NSJ-179]|uniref:MMPL family transporter n=1 Tax=Lederbergia sp. NSJ-179 TaxID=2931402 RepID=UPI001FD1A61D|nr:MMPL family transporter [Lederbergia sp. NSJ-179]MCJ7842801.1 MMPL family transporter [Lederbergia sp. NSJ-179]